MSSEDKWFPNTTWEGEPVTKVFFEPVTLITGKLITRMIDQYLQSLFFKNLELPDSTIEASFVWLVDMSRKEYTRIRSWEASQLRKSETIPSAKPSQLPLYMVQFRGTLSGAKFGI